MTAHTVRLLHVEDDEAQRLLISHQLKALDDYAFAITPAESEDEAVRAFERQGADLVILDYHLAQGNGLSCLQRLRRHDTLVPIIALSGMATPTIAAELLATGADDYLGKKSLETDVLCRSVRTALTRAEALRRRTPPRTPPAGQPVRPLFEALARDYIDRLGPEFTARR